MVPRFNPIDLSGNIESIGNKAFGQSSRLPTRELNRSENKVAAAGVAITPSKSVSTNFFTTLVRLSRQGTKNNSEAIPLPSAKSVSRFATLKPPTPEALKESANQQLLNPDIKPGNKLLLENMRDVPQQLKVDLNRSGTLIFGEQKFQANYYGGKPFENIFRWASANITDYIKKSNPNLNINHSKMNEILYSTVQSFANEIAIVKNDSLPSPDKGWGASPTDTKMTTKFEFEKKNWGFSDPETLVVSKRIEKEYVNFQNEKLPNKKVIIESQIKHNLKTGEVTFNYNLTVDGKKKYWNPAK